MPPTATRETFNTYLGQRDPILGWPSKTTVEQRLDARGARLSPANSAFAGEDTCLSLYGDSYTFGDEVGDADAWSNVLAEMLECPVANFGMSGFGVDQAVLRFEGNEHDASRVTILGITSFDLLRNMNQWRYLAARHGPFEFKPTYLDREDHLTIVPIPVNDYESFQIAVDDPESILKNESLLPDSDSLRSPVTLKFPYSLALLRLSIKSLRAFDFQRFSIYKPMGEWFYPNWYESAEGPSRKTIQRNTMIISEFANTCRARSKDCVLLTIPTTEVLNERQARDRERYGQMAKVIKVWDPTSVMLAKMKSDGACQYIGKNSDCIGHYNAGRISPARGSRS